MNIHSQARTTPKIREEIRASKGRMTLDEAAEHFNVSRSTILKWRNRESVEDRSHRPKQIQTALTPIQEDIVVLLRRSLLLTVDDLLVVTREFIKPEMVRSSLIRLLKRHGVNRLQDLYAEQSGESEADKPKSFKDYEPGYIHVDIKYLPNMPNDPQKRYLLVAIDRATRWVYLEVIDDKGAKTTAAFIQRLHEKCPVNIKIILTDNGKEFTDRFTANGEREPTGNHAFDKACAGLNIEHRLIPPKHPQTNGMVERFNGRISQLVKTTYFANAEEMTTTLEHYMKLYNQHIVQRNLGHSTPVQTMKEWYGKKPELFKKRVYNQSGLDSYGWIPLNHPVRICQ
jgi:transposase InsO family protein